MVPTVSRLVRRLRCFVNFVPHLLHLAFTFLRFSLTFLLFRFSPLESLCLNLQSFYGWVRCLVKSRAGIIACDGCQKPMWKPVVCSEELPTYIENCVWSSCGLYLRETHSRYVVMTPLQATSRGSCVLGRPASSSLVDTSHSP